MSDNNSSATQRTIAFRFTGGEKLIIRYTIVFLMSFLVGLIGYYLFRLPSSDGLIKYADGYFTRSFKLDSSISYNSILVFATSFQDIKTMAYVFVAGFTMFSSLAIYWILISEALSLGFSSLFLVNAISQRILLNVGFFDLVFFLITSSAISSLIILYCAKTRLFNEEFRSQGNVRLKIFKHKPLYIQMFTLLTLCGAIILINILRFIFNLI